ncbi:hypothetical protein SAMN05216382_2318 [Sphingomonas palmae]|uniref:Uncharacterized protein n=1 Tax=Sphingomonas palmae TaxID=1855283 RepID=A0A1H7RQ83_9SPHN|nr:hypothetical protein [Sphingomonas palmae]SEL62325.1 hypothetical protein SAMN05216382_2318 [Sphingomonas palmae]
MTDDTAVQARRREIASEHLLFKLIEYVEAKHPGLLDYLEGSLDHLGDPAHDETKDDEAVRTIARKMIIGARAEGAK